MRETCNPEVKGGLWILSKIQEKRTLHVSKGNYFNSSQRYMLKSDVSRSLYSRGDGNSIMNRFVSLANIQPCHENHLK